MENFGAATSFRGMKATDKKQTPETDLERARRKQAAVKTNKNWMKTVGLMEDTPAAREAWALGEKWRREQVDP